ncbi:MAG TPA: glycosyltransferase family 2 protein [Caulobacteraceae bacterium]|jgi:glycosyltransferase involved in cell wall biosynthesis
MPLDFSTSEFSAPEFSVVVPVFNEEGAAEALALEIASAFDGESFEILFVDDASTDATRTRLTAMKARLPMLRVITHARNAGQSRAIRTGVLAARAPFVVTLDGDGQNDPADAPRLARALRDGPARLGLIGGLRLRRQDSLAKRWASRLGNSVRNGLLRDGAADTGCGLKAFRREAFLRLPYFDHLHRFLPALFQREGYDLAFEPVGHRARTTGASKYTNLGRLFASAPDLLGVMWLRSRARDPGAMEEVEVALQPSHPQQKRPRQRRGP